MKKCLIFPLLIFIFFLIIFSSKAEAYSNFVYNPYFDSDVNGITVYNQINQTISWNATCLGLTGCLLITSNGSSSIVNVYQNNPLWNPNIPQRTDNVSLITYCYIEPCDYVLAMPTISPNKEGLLILNYRWNDTVLSARLYLVQLVLGYPANPLSYNITINQELNKTPNVWHNLSFTIPARTDWYRTYSLFIQYVTDDVPTQLAIDKFKFYTLDTNEIRTIWSSNATYERNRYCGEGSSYDTSLVDVNDYFFNNITVGYLLANDSEKFQCHAFKIGNLTIARRVVSQEVSHPAVYCDKQYGLYAYRDFYFISGVQNCDYDNADYLYRFLISSFSLTNLKMTLLYYNTSAFTNKNYYFLYDDIWNTKVNIYNNAGVLNLINNTFYLNENVNLTPFSNYSYPSGFHWRYINADTLISSYYPFFITPFSCSDISGIWCDATINAQFYVFNDCSVSSPQWCANWFCQGDGYGFGCNFGTVGSWCLDECTWISYANDGSFTTGHANCPFYKCYNITYPNGTTTYTLWNDTDVADWIDKGGSIVNGTINITTCTNTATTCYDENCNLITCPTPTIFTNPANAIALLIGGIFGISDLPTAQAMSSTVISFICSIAIVGLFAYLSKGKMDGKSIAMTFLFSMLILLIFFTYPIGWFPTWLLIIVMALDGLVIYQMMRGG